MRTAIFLFVAVVGTGTGSPALAQKDGEPAGLSIEQSEAAIVVRQGDRVVLTYNKQSPPIPAGIDPLFARSGCLHPVLTPSGKSVTTMFPVDHPHQQGVFSAWVKATYNRKPVDFWNAAKGTGKVLHERVVEIFETPSKAGFEVDLIHRALKPEAVDVLRERWRITVHVRNDAVHCFDLETTQSALTDRPLKISKYRYGGVAVRGPTQWLSSKDNAVADASDEARSPSGFLNNLGSDRVKGNHEHAKWVSLWGELEGKPVSITVLSHADNFRAPQAARLHPTKPYFCYAPCVDDSFVIDREHPYLGTYRFLVTDAMPDPEQIEQEWQAWCGG